MKAIWDTIRKDWDFIMFQGFILAVIALMVLAFAVPVRADCGAFFKQTYAYSYAQPVQYVAAVQQYYVPPVQYRLGLDIEAEALAEKVSRRVVERLKLENLTLSQTQALTAAPRVQFLAKCVQCHTGEKAKGGLLLDGTVEVDDYHFRRIVEIVGAGKDVPPEMVRVVQSLTPQEKGKILDDIVVLKPAAPLRQPLRQEQTAPPPPMPPVDKAPPPPTLP